VFKRIFGLAVSKNVQLIFTTFGLYFAGTAALMVIRTFLGPDFRPIRDLIALTLYAGCLAAGALMFSPKVETNTIGRPPDDRLNAESAARASHQLQSFNDRLERVLNA
jgi:hypothetical protein